MADHIDLEHIYTEAKSALKTREYDRARDLLTSILAVDENYRDVSRLLAQTVQFRRRRWYNYPALWTVIGLAILIGLGIVIAPKLQGSLSRQIPSPTHQPTVTQPLQSTAVSLPTPAPTFIPLSWSRLNLAQFLARDTIHAIAINPIDPDVIYIGALDAGVFKSINGGASWQPAQNGMGGASIDTLVIDPQEPDTLYAGVYNGGLYKTTDGGANWVSYGHEFVDTGGVGSIIMIDPTDHQHLYYSPNTLRFESKDSGKTWSLLGMTCPDQIGALLMDPVDQSLYATQWANDGTCTPGVYQSGDHGQTWSLAGLRDISFISGLHMGTDLHENKLLIANTTGLAPEIVQSGDRKSWSKYIGVLNNTNQHLFFSIDHGKSWNTQAIGCNTIAVDPQTPTTLYCAKTNGGLFKSTDGGSTWTDILGVNSGTFQAISVLASTSPRLVVGSTKVAISTDQGASWNNYASGLPGQKADLMLDPSNSSIFYLKYNDQYGDCHLLYRSIDIGRTWSLISTTSCGVTYGPGVTNLYRDTARVLHSTDQGAHWDNLTMPDYCEWNSYSTHPDATGALINAPGTLITDCRLFFSGSNGQRVYAISFYDYRSDDGGKSWQACGDPGAPSSSSNSRLIIDPQNPNRILLAAAAGVRISTDGCLTWMKSNEGLGSLFVNTLARDPKNFNTIYAGTDGGAYVSFNGGQSWGQINGGLLGANVVYSIVVDPQSNVYAATPYGIFKLENK